MALYLFRTAGDAPWTDFTPQDASVIRVSKACSRAEMEAPATDTTALLLHVVVAARLPEINTH
jgi:hypothetical protein